MPRSQDRLESADKTVSVEGTGPLCPVVITLRISMSPKVYKVMSRETTASSLVRQLKLEEESVQRARDRYRKELEKRPSGAGTELLGKMIEPVVDAIKKEQSRMCNPGRRRLRKHDVALLSLDPEELAAIAILRMYYLVAVLRKGELPRISKVAWDIGTTCYKEWRRQQRRGESRNVSLLLLGRNQNEWNARARSKAQALRLEEDWIESKAALCLGAALIEIVLDKTSLFAERRFQEGKGRIQFTKVLAFQRDKGNRLAEQELLQESCVLPVDQPMLCEPQQWEKSEGGGYISDGNRYHLIKHRNRRRIKEEIEKSDLSLVCGAVNALQGTRWQVNREVLEVLEQLWPECRGHKLDEATKAKLGFPLSRQEEYPRSIPHDETYKEIRGHDWEKFQYYRGRERAYALERMIEMRIEFARNRAEEPAFYFPYQLDSRGRAYPKAQLFHPQSDDLGRSLLRFAEGYSLPRDDFKWITIHMANTYGATGSFSDRIAWAESKLDDIRDIAESPIENRGWIKAKKPWSFLAACKEFVAMGERNFMTHLPIALDGTCNGFQHLSALIRERRVGTSTNLRSSSGKPNDLYQQVADRVKRAVIGATDLKEEARWWSKQRIDGRRVVGHRDLVKHATMTTPYCIERYGIMKNLVDEGFTKGMEAEWKAASWLAEVLEVCIREEAASVMGVMEWFTEIAGALLEENCPVTWRSPCGLMIVHEYRKSRVKRIRAARWTLSLVDDSDWKSRDLIEKQKRALPSNFIQSLDAAHMLRTVKRLSDLRVRDFAMVHDSYAVHAPKVRLMNEVLREEFVAIHEGQILDQFLDDLRRQYGNVALKSVPNCGTLDLEDVLSSTYFFS